jgi:hypothetical protein
MPAIIRNDSLRVNTSSFAKMKILQRHTHFLLRSRNNIENKERSSFYGASYIEQKNRYEVHDHYKKIL